MSVMIETMQTFTGKIKKHFKKLGYKISITQTPNFYKMKSIEQWKYKIEWLAGPSVAGLMNLIDYYFDDCVIPKHGAALVRLNDFKEKGYNKKGICKKCGCTNSDCSQCIDKTGEPCHWVKPDLCSACAGNQKAMDSLKVFNKALKNNF